MFVSRDFLTQSEAQKFLELPDRSRTAILADLVPIERACALWAIASAGPFDPEDCPLPAPTEALVK